MPAQIAPATSGTLVDGVICGSPAAADGITGGAVITAVNGQAAGAPSNLTGILARYRSGDTITLTWASPSGRTATSSIRLAAGPRSDPAPTPLPTAGRGQHADPCHGGSDWKAAR